MKSKGTTHTQRPDALLVALYGGVSSQPMAAFRNWALERLSEYLSFDMAVWAGGTIRDCAVETMHYTHLFNLPSDFLASWTPRKHEDGLLRRILAEPGHAFTESDLPSGSPKREDTELYKRHSVRHGIARGIAIGQMDPITGLFSAIGLYRKKHDHQFDTNSAAILERVMPHLLQSASLNQLLHYRSAMPTETVQASGLCDGEGLLHLTEPNLVTMLREEWADWHGAWLPTPITDWLRKEGGIPFVGKHIVAEKHAVSNIFLIRLRAKGILETLTRREAELVPLLVKGATYKEIAGQLYISRSTVNKHVLSIYKKLGVTNKAELSNKILSGGAEK